MQKKEKWSVWIDRGGTFTDIIARSPDGRLHRSKKLSERRDGSDAVLEGIKEILIKAGASIKDLGSLRMGTTIGTNALLQRGGAPVVFVCTKGFADAVRIAYQNRPDIFALRIQLPEMLYKKVIEFQERLDFTGKILMQPDVCRLRNELRDAYAKGFRSCAIALMHAYKFPEHELLAAEIARQEGFSQISMSHDCAALMKYVSRADTALVDAYLTPLLTDYIKELDEEIGSGRLQFMQSSGGLAEAHLFRGKDCILSGPAGGLIGAIKAAQDCSFEKLITFDMGGTSTDVSYFGGSIEYNYDREISGLRIRAPMMDIHTVAAGGGSILRFDGQRCLVGPDSCGANPGPMSYRRNGPLSLTDANIMTGRIQPDYFPRIFGPEENESLDKSAVKEAFGKLSKQMRSITGHAKSPEELAWGFIKIAASKMSNAIKHVTVQRGHDTRDCALVCFGGAGGQQACVIAEELGIRTILIHPLAGLLSAYGIGMAKSSMIKDVELNEPLDSVDELKLQSLLDNFKTECAAKLSAEEAALPEQNVLASALVLMEGSDYSLQLPLTTRSDMAAEFEKRHLQRYGFIDPARKLILASLSMQHVSGESAEIAPAATMLEEYQQESAGKPATTLLFDGKEWLSCKIIKREQLKRNELIHGPAIITESHTTTVVEAGWQAELLHEGTLRLFNDNKQNTIFEPKASDSKSADPVMLELFNGIFTFTAEQMGITLQNTSHSVNIKERLDFSCAIFDADGNMVANAPHIPVHLGSMGESVKSLIAAHGRNMHPGDVYAANDPYNGGTHLPDITVISPAFSRDGRLLFFAASRGHHSEIGGITPGSMPADSKSIGEEGVLFQNMLIARDKHILEKEIRGHLLSSEYPSRNPEQNLADLKAQIAANSRGINLLEELLEKWGEETVISYMAYVQDNAEQSVRRIIESLNSGSFQSRMDDGSLISVRVEINRQNRTADIDFSGSSPESNSNFNAPLSICKSAVLFVFRSLVPEQIPLNAGCFRPLNLTVPESSVLNPRYPAPVVAGNVETSQVIADTLYAALGIMASSQGSMNNLSFGNDCCQYYETICGGSGAGSNFDGVGPVHSHMTNSRLTDPELLEARFPVLLETFAVRKDSGGRGRQKGGNGAVRKIRFLERLSASIVSNRRISKPHGLKGGGEGAAGKNYIIRADGKEQILPFRACFELFPNDSLCIETPGGGGFGQEDS